MSDFFSGPGKPINESDFSNACERLAVKPAALWAVLAVETKGFGFFPDRRPKILFERHIFANRTGHAFSVTHPEISGPPGGYLGGAAEYGRLANAMALNRAAALESASWGLGQVMGFNAPTAGYASAERMVAAFVNDEGKQLAAMVDFVLANAKMAAALQNQDWAHFAFSYNGASYQKNQYDTKLKMNYDAFVDAAHRPAIPLRTAQVALTYLNFSPNGVDGLMGPGTRNALIQFQKAHGLPTTGELSDPNVIFKLNEMAGWPMAGNSK